MQRRIFGLATSVVLAGASLALAGCTIPQPNASNSTSSTATPSSAASSPTPGPSDLEPSVAAAKCPHTDGIIDGLLADVRVGQHPSFDRVVFEFCGSSVPSHTVIAVNEVRMDPSDQLVALKGKAFMRVVFQGGTTDSSPRAADPKLARKYTGPLRLTTNYPRVNEVAFAGDFESVLSFGIGLDHAGQPKVQVLSSPPRLVLDFS